jgi:hypothetical protein
LLTTPPPEDLTSDLPAISQTEFSEAEWRDIKHPRLEQMQQTLATGNFSSVDRANYLLSYFWSDPPSNYQPVNKTFFSRATWDSSEPVDIFNVPDEDVDDDVDVKPVLGSWPVNPSLNYPSAPSGTSQRGPRVEMVHHSWLFGGQIAEMHAKRVIAEKMTRLFASYEWLVQFTSS